MQDNVCDQTVYEEKCETVYDTVCEEQQEQDCNAADPCDCPSPPAYCQDNYGAPAAPLLNSYGQPIYR